MKWEFRRIPNLHANTDEMDKTEETQQAASRSDTAAEPPAKRQRVDARRAPDHWIGVLQSERLDDLPVGCAALLRHFERELPEKIPVAYRWLQDENHLKSEIGAKLFIGRPASAVGPVSAGLVPSILNPTECGSDCPTEMSYHYIWDTMIMRVLMLVTPGRFLRHINESTYPQFHRPNFCFYLRNQCVFRGEEMPWDMYYFRESFQRLSENRRWRYGDAPYLLSYAAVGTSVTLAMIRPEPWGFGRVKAEEIESYELDNPSDRLKFFLAILNLSTLLEPLAEQMPLLTFPEYDVITQSNGVRIWFTDNGVIKQYPADVNYKDSSIEVYEQMAKHRVPNVVNLVQEGHMNKRLLLSPLGIERRPTDVKQLLLALRDILRAVVALHKIGWMHRDLRWPNILAYEDMPDKWFLIDFEGAKKAPASKGAPHFNPKNHAPEIASPHSVEVDIWSIGYLLETTRVRELTPPLEAMKERCFQVDPTQRPTAAELYEEVSAMLKQE